MRTVLKLEYMNMWKAKFIATGNVKWVIGFFLKERICESTRLYQISNGNLQKDNFHNAFYWLTCPKVSDIRFMKNNPSDVQLTKQPNL